MVRFISHPTIGSWLIHPFQPVFQLPGWDEEFRSLLPTVRPSTSPDLTAALVRGKQIFRSAAESVVDRLQDLEIEQREHLVRVWTQEIFLSELAHHLGMTEIENDDTEDQTTSMELILEAVSKIQGEDKAREWVEKVLRETWAVNLDYFEAMEDLVAKARERVLRSRTLPSSSPPPDPPTSPSNPES